VIRELDPQRAERLMREQNQVSAALKQYPNGLKSLDSSYGDTAVPEEQRWRNMVRLSSSGPDVSPADTAANEAAQRHSEELARAQEEATTKARENPKEGLRLAMALPLWGGKPGSFSPRALTLVNVALIASRRDPEVATKAIDEVLPIVEQMRPMEAARTLGKCSQAYLNLNDAEHVGELLSQGQKMAQRLYDIDTNADNPNLAVKAIWPSAMFWRRLVTIATKLSPDKGEQIIAEIPDAEIRAFQNVTFANTLLGATEFPARALVWHRTDESNSMYYF
jgi:hypothetical protein